MPVDRVMVVRVFPGGPGAQPSAVAIAYAKDGTVVIALSGTRGQAVAASAPIAATPVPLVRAAVTPGPSGVDSRAADAVSEITRDHRRNNEDAQRQYDEQYVAFNEVAAVTSSGGVVATWSIPYQGKYRKPLDGVDFYLAVEREDLADKYRGKRVLKIGLILGGIATGLAGLGVLVHAFSNYETDECEEFLSDGDCLSYRMDYTYFYMAGGLYAVGTSMMLVGMNIDPHPIEPTEARRISTSTTNVCVSVWGSRARLRRYRFRKHRRRASRGTRTHRSRAQA